MMKKTFNFTLKPLLCWVNPLKKENLGQNLLYKNMISADVKADVKQQVIKELVPISSNFLYIQNLNDNVKLVCIFGFT